MTTAAKKLTIAELLAQHAAELKPAVGDKAMIRYHGYTLHGVITVIDEQGRGVIEPENPAEDWGWHRGSTFWLSNGETRAIRGLFFGYDGESVFNITEGKWSLHADHD